jgi:hypothetical protein
MTPSRFLIVSASLVAMIASSTPLATVAFAADANTAADAVLGDAVSQTQNMMVSMSRGCGGGPNGVPPLNWTTLQPHGNSAVNALNAAKLALANGQTPVAVQQINSAEGELDALVNGIHSNCEGGSHGEDAPGYAGYLATRATVKGQLEVVKRFLS